MSSKPGRKQPGPTPKGYQMLTSPQVLGQPARVAAEGAVADATLMFMAMGAKPKLHTTHNSCILANTILLAEPMNLGMVVLYLFFRTWKTFLHINF